MGGRSHNATAGRAKEKTEGTIRARLNRTTESVTVSYLREDGIYATVIGYGDNVAERVHDADGQLPRGSWKRLCVSTPVSIFADLQGREPKQSFRQGGQDNAAYPTYENKTVLVP